MIPDEAVEAAAKANYEARTGKEWRMLDNFQRPIEISIMRRTLEAAAPHILADILEDAANTAETDELTTAAEVIYDLRRHAKDLRPTSAD